MRAIEAVWRRVPEPFKAGYRRWLRPLWLRWRYGLDGVKHGVELHYWVKWARGRGGEELGGFYRSLLLRVAGRDDDSFLADQVVADFGCGPIGSLRWATVARRRIGIDVLADAYARHFDLGSHGMEYVASTERSIPLADECVDVLFTVNAMDHVDDFPRMASEVLRILRPGGLLIGSFNLDEPPTDCEPQTLTEEEVRASVLDGLEIESLRIAPRGPDEDIYRWFDETPPADLPAGPRYLWVSARKPPRR